MDLILNFLVTVSSAIVLIGIIVGIHELGHFLAAKYCGVQVIKFKIGFGKDLLSTRDKQGTEFSLGLLPLGGYVQMLGESGPLNENSSEEEKMQSGGKSYTDSSLGARALITFAGPFANIILAIICYFLIFTIGIKDISPMIGSVAPGTLAEEAGLGVGDKVLFIDNKPVLSFRDINTYLASRMGETGSISFIVKESLTNQEAKKLVNITTWNPPDEKISVVSSFGIGPFIPSIISGVEPGSPAYITGIKKGDSILEINNALVETWFDLSREISKYPEMRIPIKLTRNNETFTFQLKTGKVKDSKGEWVGRIGIAPILDISEMPESLVVFINKNPLEAFIDAFKETYKFIVLILDSIAKMINGSISADNIGGPIQISVLAGSAAKAGFTVFLNMMAILSINLGLINLFPLPILDGGQLVLIAIEKVKGSPIPEFLLDYFYKFGLTFIVILMFYAVFNDLVRLL